MQKCPIHKQKKQISMDPFLRSGAWDQVCLAHHVLRGPPQVGLSRQNRLLTEKERSLTDWTSWLSWDIMDPLDAVSLKDLLEELMSLRFWVWKLNLFHPTECGESSLVSSWKGEFSGFFRWGEVKEMFNHLFTVDNLWIILEKWAMPAMVASCRIPAKSPDISSPSWTAQAR